MANGKVIGIEIGNYRMKLVSNAGGEIRQFVSEVLPDDSVKDGMITYWDAMSQFLRETVKAHGISGKKTVMAIPMSAVFIRRTKLPLMTVEQLKINLPFEFHDYITEDMNKYIYDYAVMNRTENGMELLAVACSKEIINKYKTMCKAARLNLVGLVPEAIGLQRIIQRYNEAGGITDKDYAVLDLGDRSLKLHFFKNGVYEITRNLEPGCHDIANAVAELEGKDIHISKLQLEQNAEQIPESETVSDLYGNIAVQIMRVLNFYSFNNPANTIDTLYYCGGGSKYPKLLEEIAGQISLPLKRMTELMPGLTPELEAEIIRCPQCCGITF